MIYLDEGILDEANRLITALAEYTTRLQRRGFAVRLRTLARRRPDLHEAAARTPLLDDQIITTDASLACRTGRRCARSGPPQGS